ncbi:uncharacterized protein LOC115599325 isoform X2 [Calypte anna]|uniref:uncharacterized protein LOC115599325 isoform X2 n=1 Tax=Calypte anna TaxID=9244 RepID=UPI0011C44E94|nr:uncharacterized protein LOC115599325 isoform X2 [Calypte anna]
MARREPLLTALKGGVLRLREGRGPCTDTSPHLTSFCQVLETILRKGLRQPTWGFRRRDYWHWLEQLPVGDGSRPTPLSTSIQQAGSCREVLTAQGRGRHFLRLALQEKLLEEAVRQLARTPRLLEFYDPVSSILGNETLLEPFLSLLLVVTEMDFSLDLQNCSFLDESWLLPVRAPLSPELTFCHLALSRKSNEEDEKSIGGECCHAAGNALAQAHQHQQGCL